jgi:glutathione-regulated potassium-efflux system protein KefB
MPGAENHLKASLDLVPIIVLLTCTVIAVPLFRRLGLGSVLGYLAAGVLIGPFMLGVLTDPETIMHIAELGVMMFLFTIGLEIRPPRLWAMRGEIFGLGFAQVAGATLLLTGAGIAAGVPPLVAFVAGTGFVLTSTAIVVQMLDERRELSTPLGRRMIAILLFEDLSIIPLLALVTILAQAGADETWGDRTVSVLVAVAAIAALLAAGRWLLNPLFHVLASSRAREVMTAAALLVVIGAAWFMQRGGVSMALGAFVAGVLLSESNFRHQLEADIAPFRGLLLGLFFLSVGMALDLSAISQEWQLVAVGLAAFTLLKSAVVYCVARAFRAGHAEALQRMIMMAQGGEFSFVLFAAAASLGVIDSRSAAIMTAVIILSMVLTPLLMAIANRLLLRPAPSMVGVEAVGHREGEVLIVGFGRFGHIVSQPLLARGYSITIIDSDPQMIRDAADFGFKVYFGDGARLDILEAAGAGGAKAILVCVDGEEAAVTIAEAAHSAFPQVPVLARAKHREHAFDLLRAGVSWQIRDTLESAFAFAEQALRTLGDRPEVLEKTMAAVRRADAERFEIQRVRGLYAGLSLLHSNTETPELEGDTK